LASLALAQVLQITLESEGRGLEVKIRDDRPAGSKPSLEEFEDRCILLSSRGFEEVERQGEVATGEQECQNCLTVFEKGTSCPRCGSRNLARVTVPAAVTWRYLQKTDGLTNEQVLRQLSKALSLFEF